jgi:hypothetical protein
VSGDLNAKDQNRQHQRYGQQPDGNSPQHTND